MQIKIDDVPVAEFARQLKESDVASILNVTRSKLRADRLRGQGPPFRKYGRTVRYDAGDLQKWMDAQGVQ